MQCGHPPPVVHCGLSQDVADAIADKGFVSPFVATEPIEDISCVAPHVHVVYVPARGLSDYLQDPYPETAASSSNRGMDLVLSGATLLFAITSVMTVSSP